MTKSIPFIMFSIWIMNCIAQSNLPYHTSRDGRDLSLYTGYHFSFDDSVKNKRHSLELGVIKSSYDTGRHPVSRSIYFSNELFIAKKLVWGPKIGGYVNFWMMVAGAELVFYTDFKEIAPRIVPYWGFGTHRGKVTLNPVLRLSKKTLIANQIGFVITASLLDFEKTKSK